MSLQIRVPETVGVWLAEPKTPREAFQHRFKSISDAGGEDPANIDE